MHAWMSTKLMPLDWYKWYNIVWRCVAILVPIPFPDFILLLAERSPFWYCRSLLEQC